MIALESHLNISQRLIERTPLKFKRYLFEKIDWKQPLIFLLGMRGVGKTTLLLQYLKEQYQDKPDAGLYLTADDINLSNKRLVDIAESFRSQYAGKTLVIDEIHKYPNWSQELKNIYDLEPDLKIIVSGSSSLEILKGGYDLSRRSVSYSLESLSLREYINFSMGLNIASVSLDDVISNQQDLSRGIIAQLEGETTILERFRSYLAQGAYPYFKDKDIFIFQQQIVNAVNKVLYEDIPAIYSISSQATASLQRILSMITSSKPFEPNVEALSRNLGIAKETTYNYLDYLEASKIIRYLPKTNRGVKAVRKPAKIYLAHPCLYNALGQIKGLELEIGTLRESFFLSQMNHYLVSSHKSADFEVQGKPSLVFEVGGRSKTQKQIKGLEYAYLALDNIEYGSKNSIPLWLLGFLY